MTRRRIDLRVIGLRVSQDIASAPWRLLVNSLCASALIPRDVRRVLLRAAGIRVRRANIWPHVFFTSSRITIGQDVMINSGCMLDGRGGIAIGDGVALGQRVSIITATHTMGTRGRRAGETVTAPVTIGSGSWIGAAATILPGVTVGEGCVVAAGAVVTKDLQANGLYAGVPARLTRSLGD